MRLARFEHQGRVRAGVVVGDEIADLGDNASAPGYLVDVLEGGADALSAVQRLADGAAHLPLPAVRLLAPVPNPPEFLAIGLNYADHAAEGGRPAPDFPIFFNKQVTCVIGPHDPIHVPRASTMVDYEGELGVVIARRCRHVPAERAREVIGGYLVVDDVSVRDWQIRSPTMTLGKSWDTHGPIGPWIVTPDEVPDPHALRLTTTVSGDVLQDASTGDMLVDVWEQIATLSTVSTLLPGTLISTGTPSGVGVFRDPPRFLVPGDTARVEIEGIGTIENPVIAEPADTGRC